jgi:serine/threonine protein kinase
MCSLLNQFVGHVDFLDKLLQYDHQQRLTAQEAMMHPYFGKRMPLIQGSFFFRRGYYRES